MRDRVQRWLSAPSFPDDEQTRIAELLSKLLLALILLTLLDAALLLVFAPETLPTFWINGVAVLGFCILLWILRRGYVRLASVLLCLSLWPLTAYYLTISGGLNSPTLGFLNLFVAIGVTLFGTRGAVALGLLNTVFLAGLYLAGSRGLLLTVEAPPTLSRLFATTSAGMFLLTALIAISGHSVRNALRRASAAAHALAERNRELQREATERQRVERSLRESETALAAFINSVDDSMFSIDQSKRLIMFNSAFAYRTKLRLGFELYKGMALWDHFPSAYTSIYFPLFDRVLRGDSFTVPVRVFMAEKGIDVHNEVTCKPLYSEAGEVVSAAIFVHDVSERHQAEEELRRRDAILEALSAATRYLIKASDWQQEMETVLGILGKAARADRVMMFQFCTSKQGDTLATLRYEWDAPDIPSMLDNPLLHNIDLTRLGLEQFVEQLAQKEVTYINSENRPPGLRLLAETAGTLASLFLPIILHGSVWGTVHLSANREERQWSKSELEAFQIAADMMGTAIERKQTEEVLNKERILLRQVIDLLPDDIFVKDRESRFVLNNAQSQATLGVSGQEDLIGKSDLDFFPREIAEQWRAQEQSVMQSGQPRLEVEDFMPWHTDKRRWVLDSAVPLRDEKGEVFGLLGVSRDITERKRAELVLQQAAERLNILHQIDQAIMVAVSAGEVAQAAVQRIRQLIPCQHVSIALLEPETNECVLLAADTDGEPVEHGGSRYPVDLPRWSEEIISNQPYILADLLSFVAERPAHQALLRRGWHSLARISLIVHGQLLGILDLVAATPDAFTVDYLGIGREVADQLALAIENARLYELSQRHAAELEQRVKERTEQLEAANRAKSTFLANVNHELRTPLNAVLGFTHLLLHQENLMAEQRRSLEIIKRSGQHLLDLINDVLDMSRIEAGRITVDESSFDLYETIHEVEQLMALRVSDKKLNLYVNITPGVPKSVISDQRKLRQILINLLGNAVKFTERGHIALRVQYLQPNQPLDQPGLLNVEVEDTGQGIAEEEIGTLFQPFTQTESGRLIQQGTGLGLAITRQFIQLLGGDISVKSQIGIGSTFTFAVPVKPGDPPSATRTVSQRRAISLAPDQPTQRILVVDDADENRLLVCELLRPLGFEVREAANGQEAIDLHGKWLPHLILMDMNMPVIDGYETTRRIKASPQGQTTVIIALTASTFGETATLVLSAGCDDYVQKPASISDLAAKIEHHLGVQFVYEEDETALVSRHLTESPALTRADLLGLPRLWIRDLHALAVMADSNAILRKIEEIRGEHPQIADALANLVKTFRLETLLALTSIPPEQAFP